jgi:RNA polymerase sigma factor (sigma-70 family)
MDRRLPPQARSGRLAVSGDEDQHLLEQTRAGSDAAFEAIVHRHRSVLVRHRAQLVGDSDAEEAVQEALIKAHRALLDGVQVKRVGPWLHAIAHNAPLNLLRNRRPRANRLETDAAGVGMHQAAEPQREQLQSLVAAVRALPVRQRRAIVMRELEGRSYDEIASTLGASHGAVRQLLNRARTCLRERLDLLVALYLLVRWAAAAAQPTGALTASGGGGFVAKISAAIVLSTSTPVLVPVAATPPPSPPVQVRVHASRPHAARSGRRYHQRPPGRLAQLVERLPYKQEVGGSSPSPPI